MLESLDCFFADFAVAVTLPSSAVVRGIFDNGAASALNAQGSDPSLTAQSSDVATLAYGNTIIISGTNWKVQSIEPDGTGVTTIGLIRA
jgi:hypothetical protein